MPIDTSIYGQLQTPQQVNPLTSLAQAYQIKAYSSAADKADRDEQRQNKLLQLASSPEFQAMTPQAKANALQGVGDFENAGKVITSAAAANKDERAAQTSQLENQIKLFDRAANLAGTVRDQPTYDAALMQMKQLGWDTSKLNPTYDPRGVAQFADAALTQKDRLENHYKDLTAQNQAGTLANQQARLEFDKAQGRKPQLRDTDQGLVSVGQDNVAVPVMGPDGKPLGAKLKDLPVSVNQSIIQNQKSSTQIDNALKLLGGENVGDPAEGGMTGDKGATGLKGYLPNGLLNRVDPKGVDVRAAISDIGSLILHDRSGAAVTASESPRLMPFIPLATDDADTAAKKLRKLKGAIDQETLALGDTYSKDQGYKPSPLLNKPAAPAGKPAAPDIGGMEAELRRRGLIK